VTKSSFSTTCKKNDKGHGLVFVDGLWYIQIHLTGAAVYSFGGYVDKAMAWRARKRLVLYMQVSY